MKSFYNLGTNPYTLLKLTTWLINILGVSSGSEVKTFISCSNLLSMKFNLLTRPIKIPLKTLISNIFPAHNFKNIDSCWHYNIYEQDQFHATCKLRLE